MPIYTVPTSGTFWEAQSDTPPLPFPVPGAALFQYGPASNHTYVYEDRTISAGRGGVHPLDLGGPPGIGDNIGTNSETNASIPMPQYGTNALWLEIDGVTNNTAELVIHPPWNITNGVYDLQYTTNLAPGLAGLPIPWQWIMRSAPGQTNLYPTNASDPQGFYRVGGITSSSGTDFWIVFPNMGGNGYSSMTVYLSSDASNSGTNSGVMSLVGDFTNTFSLLPGTLTNMTFSGLLFTPFLLDYDLVTTNGIHITSSQPLSAYVIDDELYQGTAFTGYPTTMLGTSYCLMARPAYSGPLSEFAVVSTADNTTVTITPSPTANLLYHPNGFPTNLNQGATYQNRGSNSTDDVTGTMITSTAPIAVFAGAADAMVPDTNTGAVNPLMQEQLPVNAWGNQALSLSFGRPGGDSYRVLAAGNNTVVTNLSTNTSVALSINNSPIVTNAITNGVFVVTITNAGQFYDAILDGPVQFQASSPIQVAQFAQGGDTDTNGYGDPCEIMLPSTDRYLTAYTIHTALDVNGNGVTNSFLNLISVRQETPDFFPGWRLMNLGLDAFVPATIQNSS